MEKEFCFLQMVQCTKGHSKTTTSMGKGNISDLMEGSTKATGCGTKCTDSEKSRGPMAVLMKANTSTTRSTDMESLHGRMDGSIKGVGGEDKACGKGRLYHADGDIYEGD